jgi:hypothetical protein
MQLVGLVRSACGLFSVTKPIFTMVLEMGNGSRSWSVRDLFMSRETYGSQWQTGKLSLEGEPQSELDLPGGTERVDACSYPTAVYVVRGGSGPIDLSRSSRQQSIERGPR